MRYRLAPTALGRLLLSQVLLVSCGGGSPTTPKATPTPAPNLTGTWKGTSTEFGGDKRTFEMTLTITHAAGGRTFGGTVVTAYGTNRWLETITAGTLEGYQVSFDTEMQLEGPHSPNAGLFFYSGWADLGVTTLYGCTGLKGYSCGADWRVNRQP